MADSPELPRERKFVVTEVVRTGPPKGLSGGTWYRYTIGHESSPISGIRSGSHESVRRHAEGFAENLNQRALRGYSAYAPRRMPAK